MGGVPEEVVARFIKQRDELINKIRNGETTPCDGCPELQKDRWDPEKKVRTIAFSLQFPCNYACSYCHSRNMRNIVSEEYDREINSFDFAAVLRELDRTGNLALETPIELSAGEITINPRKAEIYDVIRDYPVMFFTNAYLYDERIAEHIARDKRSFINCSVDAGTRDTYRLVKGMDGFEKVRGNLYRYSVKNGGRLQLKYIILNENCSRADLDGFVELCRYCNAEAARISTNMFYDLSNLPDEIINAAIYLKKKLMEAGIDTYVLDTFGPKATKLLNDA